MAQGYPNMNFTIEGTLVNSTELDVDIHMLVTSSETQFRVDRSARFGAIYTGGSLLLDNAPSIFLTNPCALEKGKTATIATNSTSGLILESVYLGELPLLRDSLYVKGIIAEMSYSNTTSASRLILGYDGTTGLLVGFIGNVIGEPLLAKLGVESYSGFLYLSSYSPTLPFQITGRSSGIFAAQIVLLGVVAVILGLIIYKLFPRLFKLTLRVHSRATLTIHNSP